LKKIGIFLHNQKVQAQVFSKFIAKQFQKENIEVWFEFEPSCNPENTDLILVLGGDGTVLRAFWEFGKLEIPFLCINFGNIGFLSAIEPDDFVKYLPAILDKKYHIEERSVIQVSLIRKGRDEVLHAYALNDVVIRSVLPKISRQLLSIDGKIVTEYEGDGVICATSTGSTAYSLSAGGPIIAPQVEAIVITPICSRISSLSPIVLSTKHKVEIIIDRDLHKSSVLTVDGRQNTYLFNKDVIKIEKAPLKAKLVQLNKDRYFNLLQARLGINKAVHDMY